MTDTSKWIVEKNGMNLKINRFVCLYTFTFSVFFIHFHALSHSLVTSSRYASFRTDFNTVWVACKLNDRCVFVAWITIGGENDSVDFDWIADGESISISFASYIGFCGSVKLFDGIESISIPSSSVQLCDDIQSCWFLALARSECCNRRRNLCGRKKVGQISIFFLSKNSKSYI